MSNFEFRALYKTISTSKSLTVAMGDPNAFLFEPAVVVFNRLMQRYVVSGSNSTRPALIAIKQYLKNYSLKNHYLLNKDTYSIIKSIAYDLFADSYLKGLENINSWNALVKKI